MTIDDISPSTTKTRCLIVTGASSGIGRALALRAAQAGFAVLAVARRKERLDDLEQTIRARGGRCSTLVLDVRDPKTAQTIVSTALSQFGGIDVVVNNAGLANVGHLLDQSDAQIETQLQVHIVAPLRLSRQALPALRISRGQIFFIGSGVARAPTPGLGAYPAAKAAVRALSTQLRRELRGDGIAVSYVDPGAVDTEFMPAAGMGGPPKSLQTSPEHVADCIMRAIETRSAQVNAVPWQTAVVAIGEMFPWLADLVFAHAPDIIGTQPAVLAGETPAPAPQPPPQPTTAAESSAFERALQPVARRMERVKLTPAFIEQALQPGAAIELGEISMRWAGMPNKNERAAMTEVLEALSAAGYLEKTGDESWTVVRAAF